MNNGGFRKFCSHTHHEFGLRRPYLEKLKTLKTALMQDLLTGKVRVKVDEFEAM